MLMYADEANSKALRGNFQTEFVTIGLRTGCRYSQNMILAITANWSHVLLENYLCLSAKKRMLANHGTRSVSLGN